MKTQLSILMLSVCYLSLFSGVILAEDPDYGDDYTLAFAVPADGTVTWGELASADLDWFSFDCPGDTQFRITLANGENNWKLIRFYQANEFGDPVEIAAWWAGGVTSDYRTVFIEYDRPCYLRVENEGGSYSVKVETLGTNPDDSFADDCVSPSSIIVDAPATVGTLDHSDPLNYDQDWFVFSTLPLHQYRIHLWFLDNSNVWFSTHNAGCTTEIHGGTTDVTLTSWYGDDFKIHVEGDAARSGNIYWLEVTDIGDFTDDHGNTWDISTTIPSDGTKTEAVINYNSVLYSDIDWFKFTPQAHSKYVITLGNGEENWKLIRVYQANTFGDPVEIDAWWQGGVGETYHTHFFEFDRPIYLKVDNDGGRYSVQAEYIETVLPDTYSDSCTAPTLIAADGNPVVGTLDHTDPYDNDWFVFHTQPLHTYQIQIGFLNNCNVWFETYDAGCGLIYGGTTNVTLTSWKGDDYKIHVYGDINRVGNYYNLYVTDIAEHTDDHGNTSAEATPIPKDNTSVQGELNYSSTLNSDLDWFTFIAGLEGDYQFTLENMEDNWKLMRVYYEDTVGQLHEISAFWTGGITAVTNTYHLLPGQHFIRIENDLGEYFVSVLSPEPRCGDLDHPYPAGDVNKDCYVNMADLAQMAGTWLTCTDPLPPCSYIP
jgi:hypothetical protein